MKNKKFFLIIALISNVFVTFSSFSMFRRFGLHRSSSLFKKTPKIVKKSRYFGKPSFWARLRKSISSFGSFFPKKQIAVVVKPSFTPEYDYRSLEKFANSLLPIKKIPGIDKSTKTYESLEKEGLEKLRPQGLVSDFVRRYDIVDYNILYQIIFDALTPNKEVNVRYQAVSLSVLFLYLYKAGIFRGASWWPSQPVRLSTAFENKDLYGALLLSKEDWSNDAIDVLKQVLSNQPRFNSERKKNLIFHERTMDNYLHNTISLLFSRSAFDGIPYTLSNQDKIFAILKPYSKQMAFVSYSQPASKKHEQEEKERSYFENEEQISFWNTKKKVINNYREFVIEIEKLEIEARKNVYIVKD